MSRIRGKDTGPERRLRMALVRQGVAGFRVNDASMPGSPDVTFPASRLAVFVDGCFWHGCPRCYREPKSNKAFWRGKARMNRAKDRRDTAALAAAGWSVVRVWEHALKGSEDAFARRINAMRMAARPRALAAVE